MGISVRDALNLDIFKNSKVIAGHKGLDRIINRVSVFDCPIEVNRDKLVLKEGDFFISNFFPFKDNEDYALYALNFINSCGCACFCITNEYLNSFTQKLIEVWNNINFPIVTIDYTTSYGDIMNEIMSLILENQKNIILEMRISSLLENNLSNSDIHNTLKAINYSFLKYVTAIYCSSDNIDGKCNKNLIDLLSKNKATTCIPFKNGLLLLITYNNISKSELNKILDFYINNIKCNINDVIIGISDNYIPIASCKNAINQALVSSSSYSISNERIVKYSSLGTYSLLMCCKDFEESKELYSHIMKPIIDYDKENKAFLLETLINFVNHDGDYKKVSNDLFQHENTIRYRILKVKSILNLDKSNIEFYEKISIGVKLHKIYNI